MKLVCKTKCFFASRLWLPGETLEVKAEDYKEAVKNKATNPYVHFVELKDAKPAAKEKPVSEPATFSEMQKQGVKTADELLS